ncbi:MAG TPA: hypothetical protein VF490_17125 [Chryseosolibacter sp.]
MTPTRTIATFALLLAFTTGAWAQENLLDTLVVKFSQHRETFLQEKMYAHTDRSYYLTGETLWFKIYAVDGVVHKPLPTSSVAYAELVDQGGFAVLQAKIEMRGGFGSGSFFLPASLSSGHYKLRVYSNWMKNFDPEFYFHEIITIVNPFVVPDALRPAKPGSYSVELFPEGGNLVGGIKSKIGFRIADGSGRGASGRGFVLRNGRDTVATFTPGKFGIGHFEVTPSAGDAYQVVLVHADGTHSAHRFPEIQPAGYTMQLKDSGQFIRISVNTKGVADAHVFLFVHARQIIARAERLSLSGNQASVLLKKAELAEGISHFTLFNARLQPVCERLYFTYPHQELAIQVTGEKGYGPRQKVSLALQTSAAAGVAAPANLSVSVFRMDSLGLDPIDIYPYLWLRADLAGPIESPAYYFDQTNPDISAAMDNLMLTHGWRRFDWKDILDGRKAPDFFPEVNGHIIRGVVKKDQTPVRGVFTYLGSPGKIVRAYGSWSTVSGEVRYEIKDFYGPRRIILQLQADSAQNFSVQIENPFSPRMDGEKLLPFTPDVRTRDALIGRSVAMQVQDIYYYDQYGNKFAQPEVDSTAFYGKADATYFLDDYTRFPVMEEVMREYVPGVFVRKRRDGFHFIVVDAVNKGVLEGDPMILLDGVPVMDADDIMKVDPLRVKKLEVIQRQYYVGQAVFSGIVSYTTYKGDLANLELDPKSISLNYEGLQLRRQFYSPAYRYEERRERLPDQRYLLYWNPDVVTDDTGKGQVEFYTSDVDGPYMVVIQGLTDKGLAGSKKYTFMTNAPEN